MTTSVIGYINSILDFDAGVNKYDGFDDIRGDWTKRLRYATTQQELDMLLLSWNEYRVNGTLPNAGGFLDQDYALMKDFQTLNRIFKWKKQGRAIAWDGSKPSISDVT